MRHHDPRTHVRMHQKSSQRAQNLVAVIQNSLRGTLRVDATHDAVQRLHRMLLVGFLTVFRRDAHHAVCNEERDDPLLHSEDPENTTT